MFPSYVINEHGFKTKCLVLAVQVKACAENVRDSFAVFSGTGNQVKYPDLF